MFVSSYSNDYQLAEETLLSIEEVVSRNPNFYIRYYGELCELYKKSGDVEKYDEAYRKKAEYESQD
jgi:Tfp pilus assembly protein PilF